MNFVSAIYMDVKLREVSHSDWDDILKMRNQFYGFFQKQKKSLTKKEHYKYMNEKKNDPEFHQWIIEVDKITAGYTRILAKDVSIMIKKEFQKKGIGSKALKLLEKKAEKLKIPRLIGVVRSDNITSQEIFQNNKYKLKWFVFEKNIIHLKK